MAIKLDDKQVMELALTGERVSSYLMQMIDNVNGTLKSVDDDFQGNRADDVREGVKRLNIALEEVSAYSKKISKECTEFSENILQMANSTVTKDDLAGIKDKVTKALGV